MLHTLAPSRPFRDAFDALPGLVAGGLQLRQCPRVRVKAVTVDGAWMYPGSAKWTGAGLGANAHDRRNFELEIRTTDEAILDETQARFEEIWRGRPCARCRVRAHCEAPLDVTTRSTVPPPEMVWPPEVVRPSEVVRLSAAPKLAAPRHAARRAVAVAVGAPAPVSSSAGP